MQRTLGILSSNASEHHSVVRERHLVCGARALGGQRVLALRRECGRRRCWCGLVAAECRARRLHARYAVRSHCARRNGHQPEGLHRRAPQLDALHWGQHHCPLLPAHHLCAVAFLSFPFLMLHLFTSRLLSSIPTGLLSPLRLLGYSDSSNLSSSVNISAPQTK